MALHLRKATEADAERLFHWRNDAEARANSFHTETVPYAEHVAWLTNALHDSAQEIYILYKEDIPIGQQSATALMLHIVPVGMGEQCCSSRKTFA